MSIYAVVKENLPKVGDQVLISPEIPEKKINNAIAAMATDATPENILGIIDTTLFKSAKEGAVITGDSFYFRELFEKTKIFKWADIARADYTKEEIVKDNGKKETKEKLTLCGTDSGTLLEITSMFCVKLDELANLINGILKDGKEAGFEGKANNLPLADLSEAVKSAYLKILCNFALADDGLIDPKEYVEIMCLLVRIGLESEQRIALRSYMNGGSDTSQTDALIEEISGQTPEVSLDVLQKSLIKDLIYLHRVKSPKTASYKENSFITDMCVKLKVTDQQAALIESSIKNDEDILKKRKNDTEIQKQFTDLAAKAGAVGIPIAAIYFSGSVLGLSAAGVTSGLATLGMGGLLGFSSMVSGIGVVVLLGVGAYSGIKKIAGVSELENNKQREFMLQQLIRNSQKALNYLIEDVNLICSKLNEEIKKGKEGAVKIEKLSAMLSRMMGATQFVTSKTAFAQSESYRTKLPAVLDVGRLTELTAAATKKKLSEQILNFYEDAQREGSAVKVLKENISESDLESLVVAVNTIGYFNLADASFAKMKSIAKSVMS